MQFEQVAWRGGAEPGAGHGFTMQGKRAAAALRICMPNTRHSPTGETAATRLSTTATATGGSLPASHSRAPAPRS